ncbi:MAG: dephospho-CoA kinase [Rhodobacteraceae bacterium]|nr:dephospho-CoA kinase [Paracoccaceae bacterium]
MGKSTTAAMFADLGADVWDADAAVRRLYARGGAAVPAIAAIAPDSVVAGAVDRAALRQAIAANPDLLSRIEAAVHPLVAADRAAFVAASRAPVVVCDVPLLFEIGAQDDFDMVVVVSAPADVQRARVLARATMTPAQFETILARQMPDAEKRARADRVIETRDLDTARAAVAEIMRAAPPPD